MRAEAEAAGGGGDDAAAAGSVAEAVAETSAEETLMPRHRLYTVAIIEISDDDAARE